MRYLLLITLIISILACNKSSKIKESNSILTARIDSVLLYLAKANDLNLKSPDSDTANLQTLFPLVKTIKYEAVNLNFQYRQGYDCHDQFEIIICYNDSLIYGIPFTDNYYYNRYHGDTSMYQHNLSFEKEINKAIGLFSKCFYKKGQQFDPWFSEFFVEAIMDNLTKYKCRKINSQFGDLEQIKKNIQANNTHESLLDKKCKEIALKNIKEVENETKDQKNNILLYHFFDNHCIYRFDFQTQPQNGKFVKVKVINKECYMDIII